MNTPNNKRFMNSQESIENAFINLLDENNTMKITVQSICKLAGVNRTTFYAHYADVHDLQNQIEKRLAGQISEIFKSTRENEEKMDHAFYEMFCFIEKHQTFYRAFLKHNNMSALKTILNGADSETDPIANYHISFFTAGVSEMIRIWLNNHCQEKPEELTQIICEEYCRV